MQTTYVNRYVHSTSDDKYRVSVPFKVLKTVTSKLDYMLNTNISQTFRIPHPGVNRVVHDVDMHHLPLLEQVGREFVNILQLSVVVVDMHGGDGDMKAVFHVMRIGDDGLVPGETVPSCLVDLERSLGSNEADKLWDTTAEVKWYKP